MTTSTKTAVVNYTPEQTAVLVSRYVDEGISVADLAVAFGKTTRSIIAKLSREGVYQKKAYVSKTGEAVVKKDALADKMAEVFGLTEAEADSLTKANKTALKKILDKFAEM
jgi:hypothetical protein